MATPAELDAVADALAEEGNAYLSADQVAEKVLGALAHVRRRPWRYIVVGQDRSARFYDLRMRFGTYPRRFFPTYARGPFQTLAEARQAAGRDRRGNPRLKVMTAEVFGPDDQVDIDQLKEVSA